MLLSSVSSSIVSSSANSSTAISMITTPGLTQYFFAVIFSLVMLLCLKEILSSSQNWNKSLNNSFNLVILPLAFCFIAVAAYKVVDVIS